jgi:transcription elongation factor S-II
MSTNTLTFHIDKSNRNQIKKKFSNNFDTNYINELELELYNKTKTYVIENDIDPQMYLQIYEQFARDIEHNLNDKNTIKDNRLEQHVKKFKINPNNLVSMKPYELQPKTWERVLNRSKLAKEKIKNAGITDRYTCPKCGEKRFKEELRQTRSADEPATLFIKCLTSGCNYGKSF